MPEQERRQKPVNPNRQDDQELAEIIPGKPSAKGQEVKEELDDLLDEIDEVLEVNAEDFVKAYIQKGGQ